LRKNDGKHRIKHTGGNGKICQAQYVTERCLLKSADKLIRHYLTSDIWNRLGEDAWTLRRKEEVS